MTRIKQGKVDKMRVGNGKAKRDRVDLTETPIEAKKQNRPESTKSIGEGNMTPPKSQHGGE